jgi:hypothetical protein
MHERHLPISDAHYRPLKSFVAKRGGLRLGMHGALRDRIVEMVVEDWPVGCPADRLEEVVRARVSVRVRQKYGSIVAMFLLSIAINAIVKIIIEWWFAREAHRVLMVGWASASQNPHV